MSERDLQDLIIEIAQLNGWLLVHFRAARTKDGSYVTAIQGHAGFPDLVLVRGERLLFAELKSKRGRVDQDQRNWLDRLAITERVEVYLWRPAHLEAIKQILSRRYGTWPPQMTAKESGAWEVSW